MPNMKKHSFKIKHSHKFVAKRQSFKITAMYFILGCVWIILSDIFANYLVIDPRGMEIVSIAKGVIYVGITSFILYKFIYSALAKQKISERKLHESQRIFKTVFEQAPIGIAIVNDYNFLSQMNKEFEKIMHRSKEELARIKWTDITHPEDIHKDLELFTQFKEGVIEGYSMEKRFIKPDGQYIWIYMVIANIHITSNISSSSNHLCIIQDISERKAAENLLSESERSKSVLLSNLPGIAYRSKYEKGKFVTEFLSEGCYELTGYKPESVINNDNFSSIDVVAPKYRKKLLKEWEKSIDKKMPYRHEYEIINAQGEQKWVIEIGRGIFDDKGNPEAIEGIIIDIDESKRRLEHIEYMNIHDFMTGLYNRRHYETEKKRLDAECNLPISIIIADINGLRLINNAFGHAEGDNLIIETSKILQKCCRENDLLARTGGDEFGMIMPDTGGSEAYEMIESIKKECENYNKKISNHEKYINVSLAFATKNNTEESLEKIEKEADEYLLRRKIFERKSYHNALLSSIMATMYARSQETESHALRIAETCKMIGEKLCLSQQELDELYLYSMLHDIGKVAIDDRILNKQGKLTEKEWATMKMHPEIGCRIAMAVPDLTSISEYILTHHERWDGSGYPQGKRGEEIPLISRILAVADAFDAMTENRIYRSALSREEAINEIKNNAGIQFDPDIVRVFLEIFQ